MTGFSSEEAKALFDIFCEYMSLAHPMGLSGMLNKDNYSAQLSWLL